MHAEPWPRRRKAWYNANVFNSQPLSFLSKSVLAVYLY